MTREPAGEDPRDRTPPASDRAPYVSAAVQHATPERMAALALLAGVEAPPVATARVLEIGCGEGGNVLSIAAALPRASGVGLDLSAVQIAAARRTAAAAGLANLTLKAGSFADISWLEEPYDYVVAHGVYSWVPPEMADELLATVQRVLSPTGIAYVSYNTFPGWHLRGTAREMLQYHVETLPAGADPVAACRALLRRIADTHPWPDTAYAAVIQAEARNAETLHGSHLLHDLLSGDNNPVGLRAFARRAALHRLDHLCDTTLPAAQPLNHAPEAAEVLASIADPLERAVAADHWLGRAFRADLLVQAGRARHPAPAGWHLDRLHLSAPVARVDGEPGRWRAVDGPTVAVAPPAPDAALAALGAAWPGRLTLAQLAAAAGGGNDGEVAQLARDGIARGLIQVAAAPAPFTTSVGPRPVASPLARVQAAAGNRVASLDHRPVRIDDRATAAFLAALDGTRDRAALAALLAAEIAAGRVETGARPLDAVLDDGLAGFARQALLAG